VTIRLGYSFNTTAVVKWPGCYVQKHQAFHSGT